MFETNTIAVLEQRKNFKPKQKDRFTIVIFLEGDDPECINDLIGGEIKMHMVDWAKFSSNLILSLLDQRSRRR